MLLPCHYPATTLLLPAITLLLHCYDPATRLPCYLPCQYPAITLLLPCYCHAITLILPCYSPASMLPLLLPCYYPATTTAAALLLSCGCIATAPATPATIM